MEMIKHSYHAGIPAANIRSQVALVHNGFYYRIFAIETDTPVVKVNTRGPCSGIPGMKKVPGRKLSQQLIAFARDNLELAK